jgi:drug/metabolite transporter (DMT)-like permease
VAYFRAVAHAVLLLTLLVWSFSFLAAARLRESVGLVDSLVARFLPVVLGAGLLLLWRRPLRLPRSSWWKIAAMAALGVPAYNFFFFHGLKTVPSGTAALIIALNPAFTAVLARVGLGESFGPRKMLGLLLALVGVFVVIRFGSDKLVDWPYLSSALLLALAPLSWALYTVIGRRMPAAADALDTTYALLFFGGLPLVAFATPQLAKTLAADPGALVSALYLALPCTLFGYAAWIWALKRLPAGEVAAFVFLNPPLATLWAWLFENQPLRPPFVIGALVLLVGVAAIVAPFAPEKTA